MIFLIENRNWWKSRFFCNNDLPPDYPSAASTNQKTSGCFQTDFWGVAFFQLFLLWQSILFMAVLQVLLPESDSRVSTRRQFSNCHFLLPSLPFILATKLVLHFLVVFILQTKAFPPFPNVAGKGRFLFRKRTATQLLCFGNRYATLT